MTCACSLAGTQACICCRNSQMFKFYNLPIQPYTYQEPIDYDKLAQKIKELMDKTKSGDSCNQ